MDCVSVFDPSFSAYGRLVPGCDTAALEQALYARRQPEEGMVLVSRIAEPRLRTAARALKAQLLGDAPASTILYSGRNTFLFPFFFPPVFKSSLFLPFPAHRPGAASREAAPFAFCFPF